MHTVNEFVNLSKGRLQWNSNNTSTNNFKPGYGLINCILQKTAVGYGIEISSDKSKILVNIIRPRPSTNIWMDGEKLEEVDRFKTANT